MSNTIELDDFRPHIVLVDDEGEEIKMPLDFFYDFCGNKDLKTEDIKQEDLRNIQIIVSSWFIDVMEDNGYTFTPVPKDDK